MSKMNTLNFEYLSVVDSNNEDVFRGKLIVKSDIETKTFLVEYKQYIHGFIQFSRIESLQYSFRTHFGVNIPIQPVSFYTSINENTSVLKNVHLVLYKTNSELKTVTSIQLELENSISLNTEDNLDYLKRNVVTENARMDIPVEGDDLILIDNPIAPADDVPDDIDQAVPPPVEEPVVEEPVVEEPAVEEPPAEEPQAEEPPAEEPETLYVSHLNDKGCFPLFPSNHPTKKTKILQMIKKDFALKTSNTLRTTRARKEARRVNPGCMPRMWRKTHQFAK